MKRLLVFILCVLIHCVLLGQEEIPVYHPIEKSDWNKAVDGLNYNEKIIEEEEVEISQTSAPLNFGPLLQIIGFILIAALLIFVLFYFFGRGLFGNPKVESATQNIITDLEERPMESDLERYLREALASKNYRLAIRIYYLMMLKSLHEKSLITWKKDKTNMDYLIELRNHPQYDALSKNTLIYEFVWYGDKSITDQHYNEASPLFIHLIQQLQSKA